MVSKHVGNFFKNLDEVKRLITIHEKITGKNVGYKTNVEVLNKSSIVLLVACWEAYIEDLIEDAFDFVLKNAKNPKSLPKLVLSNIAEDLKKNLDDHAIWQLAGTGWLSVVENYKKKCLDSYLFGFNTPKPNNIDELFKSVLGIKSLSSYWHWSGMSSKTATNNLKKLVEIRGNIAHRVAASKKVYKYDVTNYIGFVNKLAVISNNRIHNHLKSMIGKPPWDLYHIGRVH
jgi:hypothetical protein